MGCGIIIERFGGSKIPYVKHTCSFHKESDKSSNNMAEYLALGYALLVVGQLYPNADKVTVIGDSQLVINQMSGKWRIKEGSYVDEAHRALAMLRQLQKRSKVELKWVPREDNTQADSVSR